jgi:mRNA-degrading endonuclease RelE of RelBE toxin-antitoxin system
MSEGTGNTHRSHPYPEPNEKRHPGIRWPCLRIVFHIVGWEDVSLDLEILNRRAEFLNEEATDVLTYVSAWYHCRIDQPGDNMDPFEIVFTVSARQDLKALRRYEQRIVLDGIYSQPLNEPTLETPNRKRMQPNAVAGWEMRVGRYRVLYDMDEQARIVTVLAIGFKAGNQLYIRGEKRKL